MKELLVLIFIFWLPILFVLIKNLLWSLYFWQIKEYRWDRFWTHIRWDQEDRNRNTYLTGLKFIIFAFMTFLFTYPAIGIFSIILAYIIWSVEAFEFAVDTLQQKIIKPSIKNLRNILIIALYIFVLSILIALISIPFLEIQRSNTTSSLTEYFNYINNSGFNGISNGEFAIPDIYFLFGIFSFLAIFLDIAAPIISTIFVYLTAPISFIKREFTVYKARKKLSRLPNLKIIGITGSQGKTTTKEILYELIKNNFITVKTPENLNTDIGVAQTILNYVGDETQVLIAEMGTYKTGELRKICKNFPPDISIITDIDTQHVGLFGSRQKLAAGKAEIAEYMKKGGTIILNGDNEYCKKIASNINEKVIIVASSSKEFLFKHPNSLVILADDIKSDNKQTQFNLKVNGIKYSTKYNYSQSHLWLNFSIAFSAALALDLKPEVISKLVPKVDTKLPRLEIETGDNNFIIINDSYNSSLKGFLAAVDFMNMNFKGSGKRIILTKGIFELGKLKNDIYENLIEKIKDKFDILITTDIKLAQIARKYSDASNVYTFRNVDSLIYEIRKLVQPEDILLIEGRVSPRIMSELVSDKR